MKKFKLVTKKVDEIKPDPDQPRKIFDEDEIENLANSIKSQGIINPVEIDEDSMIITGERRWRASKKAGLEEIQCKVYEGLDSIERLERQTIENLHHNLFTSEEKENVITELWNSGRYETQKDLANVLGMTQSNITMYTIAKKGRKVLGLNSYNDISSQNIYHISRLPKSYQKDVITKIEKGRIKPSEIREFISSVKDMPSDIKTEILKPSSELTLEEAIDISQVQDPEMRKESINFVKKQKKQQEKTKQYVGEIARGEKEPYEEIKEDHFDQKIIKQSIDLSKKIYIKWRRRNIESFNSQAQIQVEKIIREIQKFLREEWGERTQVIEIKSNEGDIIET